jgi:hypothetical protein
VFLSNGQSVQATKQGSGGNRYWGYTLTEVPPGQFSLSSGLSGWLIQPSGFSNPLNVSGSLSSINFNGTSSATAYGAINGRITERGVPLSGASVVARVGGVTVLSTTTDSDGYYRLANLTNGSYSVVPSLSGYTFSPSSTTASSPSSDKNFTATSSSTPPSIGSIVAAPTVVSNVNSTATFTVIATGFAPFSYSWDALTAPAPVAFSANDSPVANTTVVSFQSPGSYTFRARVVDGHGFVTTANVGLTVSAGAGALVVSPYEVQVPAGQSMAFSADAWDQLGNPTSVSPQWSVTGGGTINGSGVFAATTPGGPWQVVATTATLAATGTVWVTETSVSPPVILAQPLNQTVGVGSNVTFTVSASGTSPLYYQWRWHGTNLPGATASSYTRTNVQLFAAGLYSVEITNSVGSVLSSNAALTVIEPPQITTQPISRAIAAGSNVTFTVVASGTPPLAFQWRLNGTNLPAATTNTLQLLSAQPSNAGLYTVLVNNLAGTTTSAAAALTVNSFPALSLIADRTIHAGSALVMTTSVLDPDSPSQALTFGLAPGAPANSTINPTNGIFAWTTTLGDANTTNTVTVTVADDGVPSLSDSQSFAIRVVPPLTIASITVSNTTITICWTAIPGRTYQVQFKDDLDASPWIALQPDVLATNSVIHRTDVISIPRRLYRIALLP